MMTIPIDAPAELAGRLSQHPREVSVWPDAWIKRLDGHVLPEPHDGGTLAGHLLGERFVRAWLYRTDPPNSSAEFARAFEKLRSLRDAAQRHSEALTDRAPAAHLPTELHAWSHLTMRIASFLRCDGVILGIVVGEAVAIPFQIEATAVGLDVVDMGGEVPGWTQELRAVADQLGRRCRVRLGADLGVFRSRNDLTDGGSLALPILLAARLRGQWQRPLSVVATGGCEHDRFYDVRGIVAKRDLAQRLGAVLINANGLQGDNLIAISVDQPSTGALAAVEQALCRAGHCRWSVPAARQARLQIEAEIRDGSTTPAAARGFLTGMLGFLRAQPVDRLIEGEKLSCLRLLGTVCNHVGDPNSGEAHLREAFVQATAEGDRVGRVRNGASLAVSIADAGRIDEGEQLARELLAEVAASGFSADPISQTQCQIRAAGALGGDVLLWTALRQPENRSVVLESRLLLRVAQCHAYRLTRLRGETDDWRDLAKTTTRRALWWATVRPRRAQRVISTAARQLDHFHVQAPTATAGSVDHIYRLRWLAAWRAFLGGIRPQFEPDWPLPATNWPRATALKYRGALRAASNDARAVADFSEAIATLVDASEPLLRFILGTVATQAGESLRELEPELAHEFLGLADRIFAEFPNFPSGSVSGACWRERIAALQAGIQPTADPQKHFLY